MHLTRRILQILLLGFLLSPTSCQSSERVLSGPEGYLLPNGWTLTPAGEQIEVGDLPMNIVVEPRGRQAFVLNSGWNEHTVSVIDLVHNRKVQEVPLDRSWLGLTFDPRENRLYVSGGARPIIEVLAYDPTHQEAPLTRQTPIELDSALVKKAYISGLALDAEGSRLFAANTEEGTLIEVDLTAGRTVRQLSLGGVPYTCLLSRDGQTIYVSLWDRKRIALVDRASWTVRKTIAVGSHPSDLAMTPNGQILFVANANSNSVSVVALKEEKVIETIVTTLFPKAPEGSTPNALAITPDGQTLFVANADNNNIAWVDISKVGESEIRGFIPTGWYPSAVQVTTDGDGILVGNGKGTVSAPNPRGPQPYQPMTSETEYIARITLGAVSIILKPPPEALARYTRQVYRNTPYRDRLLEQTEHKSPFPEVVPDRIGTPSSRIEYVIYIIKENRTYDQVLGDMPEGNGDSSLTLFGEEITPNHHALAREFVLLDNFYVDAEVSADGHSWSTAAYATDYTEKTWPAGYARLGRMRDLRDEILYTPDAGFIWDLCAQAGISYRSYGEMIVEKDGKMEGRFPGLVGHVHPTYKRALSFEYTDLERAEDWIKEFKQFEKEGRVPRFQVLSLPDDHTMGTRPGQYTPFVQVARNDLALGQIVETASRSSLWHKMAIFVVEDDAQAGPDHVDAHRTVAFVISPYSRLRKVDSTFYTTSGMLRTIELILGLPPMSQFDAAATPMFGSFSDRLDVAPYATRPARIDLTTKNKEDAYAAGISEDLPLADVDEAPDNLFSEIIWKAVKGADSEMPPPVRRARLVPLAAVE